MISITEFSVCIWGALELVFVGVTMLYLAPRINRLESPAKYPVDNKRLMLRILQKVDWLSTYPDSTVNFASFLSGWFLGTPVSELKRENVLQFLAWTMYAKTPESLSKSERKNVFDMVKVTEQRLRRTLAPGHNPKARCIRHTLDPVVPFNHRPLALYALLGLVRALSRAVLALCGFRRLVAPCGRFRYWHRQTPAARDGPVVFFHGVCSGLPAYLLAIWKVCRGRTCLVIESPSITMNLHLLRGHTPPTETQLVESVESIMAHHNMPRATFFGHSFGSISVAWMARRRPHLVSQIALLDPVCLLLFLPDVASAFLHPQALAMPLVEKLLLYVVSREKGISHTLRRHFWWYTNVLWPQDIQCPMVVGLAGLDKIAPAKPIRRFLLSYPGFADTAQSSPTLRPNGTTPATRYASTAPFYPSNNSKKNAVPSPVIAPTSIPGGFADDGHGPKVGSTNADSTASEGMAIASCHGGGCVAGGNADDVGNCGDESSVFGKGGELRRETRRVELVFWPHLGHGHPLIRPRALDELVRTVEQQAQDFRLSA